MKKSPADEAGLHKGDKIVQVGNHKIRDFDDTKHVLGQNKTAKTTVKTKRDGQDKSVGLQLKGVERKITKTKTQTTYRIGFVLTTEHSVLKPINYSIYNFFDKGKFIFTAVVGMLTSIFTGEFSFDMLNGPVGIYRSVDPAVKSGIINLVGYTALLSVNLGIMNLLPISTLDGGRILSVLYKVIFRKLVNKKAEIGIIAIGTLFVVIIMILVTWNDIRRHFL